MTESRAPASRSDGIDLSVKNGDEWLAEFLLERLRRQFDWNVGLNGRASMLLTLTGIALTLLLGSEQGVGGGGSTFEVLVRAAGLALLVVSAAVLLRALRRRSESVWGHGSDLDQFIEQFRGSASGQVSAALVDRLVSGTNANEAVLSSKSGEIELGTFLTLGGLVVVAVGSIGGIGVPMLLVVAVLGLLVVRQSTTLFERAGA